MAAKKKDQGKTGEQENLLSTTGKIRAEGQAGKTAADQVRPEAGEEMEPSREAGTARQERLRPEALQTRPWREAQPGSGVVAGCRRPGLGGAASGTAAAGERRSGEKAG